MAKSEQAAVFQTHLLFVEKLNFEVIWEAIKSSGTTKHQVLIMLPLNCQKQKEYTNSFSWCRGLKKNSKGAEAGGQTAVVKKGKKSERKTTSPSSHLICLQCPLITYILLRSNRVCFGISCLLVNELFSFCNLRENKKTWRRLECLYNFLIFLR